MEKMKAIVQLMDGNDKIRDSSQFMPIPNVFSIVMVLE